MNAGELIALAERVEATAPAGQFRVITEAGMAVWGWHDPRFKRLLRLCEEGAFLDAAMTLVPEGHNAEIRVPYGTKPEAYVRPVGVHVACAGRASTPALALTAACLRAWAALAEAPSNAA